MRDPDIWVPEPVVPDEAPERQPTVEELQEADEMFRDEDSWEPAWRVGLEEDGEEEL